MNRSSISAGAQRVFLCLLLAAIVLTAFPAGAISAPAADHPILVANPSAPLFADLLQDVVGNRTRLIQVSFLFILLGIFILWKK